jgi:hypothetical protein
MADDDRRAKVFEDHAIPGGWHIEKMNNGGRYEVLVISSPAPTLTRTPSPSRGSSTRPRPSPSQSQRTLFGMRDPVIRHTVLRGSIPPRRQPPGAVRQKIAFGHAMEDIRPLTELAAAVSGEEYGEQ